MGGLVTKVKAMDPDNVFAYSTLKVVTIRDRRLGLLHYAFMLGIFVYIIVYTIIYEQRYLKTELPFGAIRSTVREPSPWPNASNIPYCRQNQAQYVGRNNYNCAYMLGRDLPFPAALMDSVFVTTRIKDTFYAPPPADCDPLGSALGVPTEQRCAPSSATTNENRYYIPGVEDYTVYIEHAIYGQVTDIAATNSKVKGSLEFNDKKKTQLHLQDSQYRRGTGDVFPLSLLLQASGIDSLDTDSSVNAANTKRYDGVLILTVVSYSNRASDSSELKYRYTFDILPGVDVISQEPSLHIGTNGTTLSRSRYGVRFLFLVGGSIGKFDFPTLLTSIISGLVLMKVSTTIVDLLLLYVMPQKLLYKSHKFEYTEDFSDVRSRQNVEGAEMENKT